MDKSVEPMPVSRAMVGQGALETVRLRDDEGQLDATFVPGAGMICCSLRHRGDELLAQVGGLAEYEHDGHTMGIPLLYPWANRLAAFDYEAGGRTVRIPHDPERIQLESHGLPIHGVIGGRQAWEVTRAPGRDGGSLSARLRWDDVNFHTKTVTITDTKNTALAAIGSPSTECSRTGPRPRETMHAPFDLIVVSSCDTQSPRVA